VYPALAVLQALENEYPARLNKRLAAPDAELSVLWVGSEGGMEADLVKRADKNHPVGIAFQAIPAAGVHGVSLRRLPRNLAQLQRGFLASREILRRFQPDVLFFTGGYVAVPLALAGMKTPSVLYVPDIEPGLALKALAWFADKIAVTAEKSQQFFSNRSKVVVSGYPVRPELKTWNKEKALQVLNLKPELPVLLVFGGSSGARSINRAVLQVLPDLLSAMQIVHITGRLDWDEVSAKRDQMAAEQHNAQLLEHYRVFPYLHEEMGAALSAADLVVARSGASTLGELPLFGTPAVLVPYPYAWRYQKVNADYLTSRGAAVMVKDQDLPGQFVRVVSELLNNRSRLDEMRKAMQALSRQDAAAVIADLLVSLGERKGQRRDLSDLPQNGSFTRNITKENRLKGN